MFVPATGPDPIEVVIAGGGVAGLEALIALRSLAGSRVRIRVVAPEREFVYRPMAVAEPFGLAHARHWDLNAIVEDHDAGFVRDTVAAVDPERRLVRLGGGRALRYDALVLAPGAVQREALPGAFTFRGPSDVEAYAELLRQAEDGLVRRLVFAAPAGVTWTLPLYELALLTANRLAGSGTVMTFVTGEREPLAAFGSRAGDRVASLLREAGIAFLAATPAAVVPGGLALDRGETLDADRVIALPLLEAPDIPGVPRAANGFIPIDEFAQVEGLDAVFAAGDATSSPVKQGGMAAQQADAAALAIAAVAGAPVARRRGEQVLRGVLLTGREPLFLRHDRGPMHEDASSVNALWWPPGKIAGQYLAPYLAQIGHGNGEEEKLLDIPEWEAGEDGGDRAALDLALEAADADASWGDPRSALAWLDVAERLAVVLPPEYVEKRELWRAAV